jgi:hypothetical protein
MRHHPLLLVLACLLLTASPAAAALRSPQVPVAGSALATFFLAQSQAINPATDQQDLQQLSVAPGTSFDFIPHGPEASASAGIYNTLPATPSLYQIWPGAASPGWFTVCSFRTSPTRLVVNLFDAQSAFQGTTTYLNADPSAFGVYGQGAAGVVYLQDARNPLGAARILTYSGTGTHQGSTWFAIETGSTAGGDFADLVLLVNLALAPVSVEHASWGSLKRRFR